MDKLQRKLKKEMKKNKQNFNDWYSENQVALSGFESESQTTHNGNTLVKNRRIWLPVAICALAVAICLAIVLPITLNKGNNNFDLTFGDDDVYAAILDDDTYIEISDNYAFINKMQVTAQAEIKLRQDDSIVMYIISGELETESDYYFIDILFEENGNYHFGYRSVYESLDNKIQINDWSVTFDQTSTDASGLYVFMLRMENNEEQIVYMEVHCFENDINFILSDFIE